MILLFFFWSGLELVFRVFLWFIGLRNSNWHSSCSSVAKVQLALIAFIILETLGTDSVLVAYVIRHEKVIVVALSIQQFSFVISFQPKALPDVLFVLVFFQFIGINPRNSIALFFNCLFGIDLFLSVIL